MRELLDWLAATPAEDVRNGVVAALSVLVAGFGALAVIGWQRYYREREGRAADARRRAGYGDDVARLVRIEVRGLGSGWAARFLSGGRD